MEIKINYEASANALYALWDRIWEKKEDVSTDTIIAAIGDLGSIDWDKFFELMEVAKHDNHSAKHLFEIGYNNIASLTEYNPNDTTNSINFVRDILDGKEPKPLNHYDLSGVVNILGGFITDHHINR